MTLTAEQLRAAAAGKKVRFLEGGVEYVVVRSELMDRALAMLEQQ